MLSIAAYPRPAQPLPGRTALQYGGLVAGGQRLRIVKIEQEGRLPFVKRFALKIIL